MTFDRLRTVWKRFRPLILAGVILGGVGVAAAGRYAGGDCCGLGLPCCHPGSPCCHGHRAQGGVASR